VNTQINRETARKVLEVVDAGLVNGLGNPEPGHMCVEAAVCYALGLPHSDDPKCVSGALRSLKIALNDKPWSSPQARAKGLRRLAIAQLGTAGVLGDKAFLLHITEMTIKKIVPMVLRLVIPLQTQYKHKEAMEAAAKRCEVEGTKDAANAAYAAAYATAAEHDRVYSFFAEEVVQILIAMKAPGTEWLDLTEAAA